MLFLAFPRFCSTNLWNIALWVARAVSGSSGGGIILVCLAFFCDFLPGICLNTHQYINTSILVDVILSAYLVLVGISLRNLYMFFYVTWPFGLFALRFYDPWFPETTRVTSLLLTTLVECTAAVYVVIFIRKWSNRFHYDMLARCGVLLFCFFIGLKKIFPVCEADTSFCDLVYAFRRSCRPDAPLDSAAIR